MIHLIELEEFLKFNLANSHNNTATYWFVLQFYSHSHIFGMTVVMATATAVE